MHFAELREALLARHGTVTHRVTNLTALYIIGHDCHGRVFYGYSYSFTDINATEITFTDIIIHARISFSVKVISVIIMTDNGN